MEDSVTSIRGATPERWSTAVCYCRKVGLSQSRVAVYHSAPSNRHRSQVGRHDRPRYRASRVARVLPLCTCHRHYPGTATGCSHRSLPQPFQPSPHGL